MFLKENYDFPFYRLGIYPRNASGIIGIFTSPFIHSSWSHFFSNIGPVFILMTMLKVFYENVFNIVMSGSLLLTGILVWIFGKEVFHVGASGVIYALISFIFWSGIFKGSNKSIVLGLIILIIYSSYFDGLKPREGVSWESHLFGAIVGVFLSFLLKNVNSDESEESIEPIESKELFFDKEVFVNTKEERYLKYLEEQNSRQNDESKIN